MSREIETSLVWLTVLGAKLPVVLQVCICTASQEKGREKARPHRLVVTNMQVPLAPKIFNYKTLLQSLKTKEIAFSPSGCTSQSLEFCYKPFAHIITGDINIVQSDKLRDILSKGPKYR